MHGARGPPALGGPLDFVHPCPMVVTPLTWAWFPEISSIDDSSHRVLCRGINARLATDARKYDHIHSSSSSSALASHLSENRFQTGDHDQHCLCTVFPADDCVCHCLPLVTCIDSCDRLADWSCSFQGHGPRASRWKTRLFGALCFRLKRTDYLVLLFPDEIKHCFVYFATTDSLVHFAFELCRREYT